MIRIQLSDHFTYGRLLRFVLLRMKQIQIRTEEQHLDLDIVPDRKC